MADTTFARSYKMDEVVTRILDHKPGPNDSSGDPLNAKWAGATWDKSKKLLTDGWKEGVARLDVAPNSRLAEALRPQILWDVAGSECDVASYLAGVPECMGEVVRRRRPSPVVRIGVDKAISCNVSADRIMNVGRNVVVLVESLRLAGIAAEVWVCQSVGGGWRIRQRNGEKKYSRYDLTIQVQEAGRPIDLSRLAYWVAHPAALRKTIFALEEMEDNNVRGSFGFGGDHGSGYGMPVTNGLKDQFDEWTPSPMLSESEIQAWVTDVMTRRVKR
jgi:hypothetical protein